MNDVYYWRVELGPIPGGRRITQKAPHPWKGGASIITASLDVGVVPHPLGGQQQTVSHIVSVTV